MPLSNLISLNFGRSQKMQPETVYLSGTVHGYQTSSDPMSPRDGDCRVKMAAKNADYIDADVYFHGRWFNFHLIDAFRQPAFLSLGKDEKLRQVHNFLKNLETKPVHYEVVPGRRNRAFVFRGSPLPAFLR